nr:MAG TPA: hypothetical protein [Caudoviricetes sp.]
MKNFFNTTDIDTISESLNGEKFLTASRNEDGCIMLGFESANEDYVDTLTIKHDGSVVGAFVCDEEQRPQTVNDTQCAANEIVKMDDLIRYENSAEFHRAYADFLDAAELLAVDGQAVVTLAELARKCADAAQLNAFRMAMGWPVMVRDALGLPAINYAYTPFNPDADLDTDSISSMLPDYFGLLHPLHEEDGCDPSEGIVLLFQDELHAKEPSMELVITPKVTTNGVPVLSVEVNDLPKK